MRRKLLYNTIFQKKREISFLTNFLKYFFSLLVVLQQKEQLEEKKRSLFQQITKSKNYTRRFFGGRHPL